MMYCWTSRAAVARAGLAVLAAILTLCVAGCGGLVESQRIEYKTAAKLPPLEVPPDLTAPTTDERFAVPDIAPSGTATYSSYNAERAGPRPSERSEVLPTVPDVRVERSGGQRWLVVRQPPDKVWPVVKQFWQEVGFLIEVERPEAGVMETNWAENRAKLPLDLLRRTLGRALDTLYSTGEQDKFRTRLERGTQPGTTEIYISHRGMEEVYTNNPTSSSERSTRWQPRPSDPDLEAELLARLMVRFGVEETKARTIANDQQGGDRAALASGADGSLFLRLDEPFDRAWRRVGLALDRVGFTVEDRDRAKGFYFVRYQEQESESPDAGKNEGFFSRLMFWRSKQAAKAEQYRILVKDGADSSQVQVLGKDGDPERSDAAKRILALLHQQLK